MKEIVLFLIFLTACSFGGSDGYIKPVVTGEDGVIINLVDAPELVYVGEEVALTYEIYNAGASTIPSTNPGVLIPSSDKLYFGYDGYTAKQEFKDLDRDDGSILFWLDGRDEFLDGEKTFVTLFYTPKPIERNSAGATSPILLTVCYPYQSNITSSVCIEQTQQRESGSIVCSNNPVLPASVGAPIGVEKIVTRNTRVKTDDDIGSIVPSFRITLRNYGGGIASSAKCDEPGNLNRAKVSAFLLDSELDCLNEGEVVFTRGVAQTTCTVKDSDLDLRAGRANFISILSITADYTYRESAKTDVRIINE